MLLPKLKVWHIPKKDVREVETTILSKKGSNMAKKIKETVSPEVAELKKKYGNEIVRVVPHENVKRILKKEFTPAAEAMVTLITANGKTITPLLSTLNISLEDKLRYEAELDPAFRQVIPYVVLRHEDKVFCTHRLSGGGEARLTGKYSIGTGGHITQGERIMDGMRRELEEEVGVTDKEYIGFELKGFINQTDTPVNAVHLGCVFEMRLRTDDIQCLEKEKLKGEWIPFKELKELYDKGALESWSDIVAANLYFGGANG